MIDKKEIGAELPTCPNKTKHACGGPDSKCWVEKPANYIITHRSVMGALACYAVEQSPYHRPDNLEIVLDKFHDLIKDELDGTFKKYIKKFDSWKECHEMNVKMANKAMAFQAQDITMMGVSHLNKQRRITILLTSTRSQEILQISPLKNSHVQPRYNQS